MDIKTLKNTLIYKEFEDNKGDEWNTKAEEWFKYKDKKFITHMDTLYYSVYLNTTCFNEDGRRNSLVDFLKTKKEIANTSRLPMTLCDDDERMEGIEVCPFMSFGFYTLHFGKKDCFDVFIAESVPNKNTCPVIVQLRSSYLWLQGAKRAFDLSCYYIEHFFKKFGFKIHKTQENRVDYAFHTNYIQSPVTFFDTKKLAKMQVSNFERWHEEGNFFDDDIEADYVTLGRRTSNNVFFRVYNKTKEVIEMGYKQFFIPIWRENGLISEFDKYILEKCFLTGNYFTKEKARCEFYLEYGADENHKAYIKELLANNKTTAVLYKKVADCLVPDLTIVCNIEFQTKRKYYYNLDIPRAVGLDETDYKANVYNIFEMYYSIINKLTYETIRFVNYKGKYGNMERSERPVADWWIRLSNAKMFEFNDVHYDINRVYQKRLSEQRQKQITLRALASYSAYTLDNVGIDEPIDNDVWNFAENLTQEDYDKYYSKREDKYKDLCKQGIKGFRYGLLEELADRFISIEDYEEIIGFDDGYNEQISLDIDTLNDNDIEKAYRKSKYR